MSGVVGGHIYSILVDLLRECSYSENWEVDNFGNAGVRIQSIKAVAEVPDWPSAFYRFQITEDTPASGVAAKSRVKHALDVPPGIDDKMHPHWALRRVIAHRDEVFIVSTDDMKLEIEDLARIFALLQKHIGGEKQIDLDCSESPRRSAKH